MTLTFPVVYRALAGLDSIAQAAGRCNREGSLPGLGRTVIFVPAKQPEYVTQPAGITRELLCEKEIQNLLTPYNYKKYFKQRFWQLGQDALDKKQIMPLLSGRMNYYFRSAANGLNSLRMTGRRQSLFHMELPLTSLPNLLLNHGCNIGYCASLVDSQSVSPKIFFALWHPKTIFEKLVIPAFPCWIIHFMTTVMVSFHQTNP